MKQNTIFFTGTLPKKGEAPFGGGEIGNLRTIRMLESFGYKVKIVRRRRSGVKDSWLKKRLAYPFKLLANNIEWFVTLLFGSRRNGLAHISGFYGDTIYVETLQVFIAKTLGYKIVYELRGGGATNYYEHGGKLYRKQFQYIVTSADYLLSQGKENEPLLRTLCSTPVFYYPNCVSQDFYPKELLAKPINCINLLFFGRIETAKNPLMIVETAGLLQKRFENVKLTMIGNGQKDLLEQVRAKMEESLEENSFVLLPGREHDELQAIMSDQHFYIFPSVQPREGQSNAVTEVMSYGIIPIASPQGFNRSTIGDDNLIVDSLTADAYAGRIASIVSNGEIMHYSEFVRKRFLENYTEGVVFENTRKEYEKMFNS